MASKFVNAIIGHLVVLPNGSHHFRLSRALKEAQNKNIPTAAIVGAASLASARYADTVISAQTHPGIGVGIVSLEAVVYALSQVLRMKYQERYHGSEQAVSKYVKQIQSVAD